MKKFLKIICIALLIIIILAIIHTARNYFIISKLQNSIKKFKYYNNYHSRTISTLGEGIPLEVNYYKKDNKSLQIITRQNGNSLYISKRYDNGDDIKTYIEVGENRAVYINNPEPILYDNITNHLETDTIFQKLFNSLVAKISTADISQKECYMITVPQNVLYIEKSTGLLIKNLVQEQYVNFEYEFNNVDDSIFIEPNINEYEIQ